MSCSAGQSVRKTVYLLALLWMNASAATTADPLTGAFDRIPIELSFNDNRAELATVLRTPTGPAIPASLAKKWRFKFTSEPFNLDGEQWIRLQHLDGANSHFNHEEARLTVTVPPDRLEVLRVARAAAVVENYSAIPALINNYQFNVASNTLSGARATALFGAVEQIASVGATRFSNSLGVTSAFNAHDLRGLPNTTIRRVDTAIQHDDPIELRTYAFGDQFTHVQSWNRSTRFFGASIRRSFSGRPDVITAPQPMFSGLLTQPSNYELFVNDRTAGTGNLGAGRYELDRLPLVTGRGEVRMVMRDALGRETVVLAPFFVSPRQLAVGLDDYAFSGGWQRVGFTGLRRDYGRFALSGEYARGLTSMWTLRASGEAQGKNINAGVRSVNAIAGVAAITADIAASRSEAGGGTFGAVYAEFGAKRMNFAASVLARSRHFWQLGSLLSTQNARFRATMSGGTSFISGISLGIIGTLEDRWDGNRICSVNTTLSSQLANNLSLFVNASLFKFGATTSKSVMAQISYTFNAARSQLIAQTSLDNNKLGQQLSIYQSPDRDVPVQLYGAAQRIGSHLGGGAGGSWAAPFFDLDASTHWSAVGNGQQVRGSGSMVYTDGQWFASRTIFDSAVLAEVPDTANVRVFSSGAPQARTDSHGFALLPFAVGYQQAVAQFEPSDMPLEANYSINQATVTPWPRSVAKVKFQVSSAHGEAIQISFADGRFVPVGSSFAGVDGRVVVGAEGLAYLENRPASGRFEVSIGDTRCTVALPVLNKVLAKSEIVQLVCQTQ
jgi:outer membrane usher protein